MNKNRLLFYTLLHLLFSLYCPMYAMLIIPSPIAKEKPYKCEYSNCNKTFSNPSSRYQHMRLHTEKKFTCNECDKVFISSTKFKDHIFMHTTGKKPYQCKTCNHTFTTESSLNRHINSIHTQTTIYTYKFCNQQNTDRSNHIRHVKSHTQKKIYTCDFCDLQIARKATYTQHMNMHKTLSTDKPLLLPQAINTQYGSTEPLLIEFFNIIHS
jgi:uncharacterized Zn-finger protein